MLMMGLGLGLVNRVTVLIIYSPHAVFCAGADLRERAAMNTTAEVCEFLDRYAAPPTDRP